MGRRGGKTTLAIREACFHARIPNRTVWICGPSYRQMKQIAWVKLKQVLQNLRWCEKINEAELTITLKNKSRISLRGADNKDSLRGVGIDFLVMDECADIEESAWTEVLRPTLSDTKGKALFCGTPKGMNWFHDLYQQGQDPTNQDWSSWQVTTEQGGWVDADEIAQAKKDLDAKTFRQEYQATFETYSGIVYYGFDMAKNVRQFAVPEDEGIIHVGMDFNISPLTAILSIIKDGIVFVFDEITLWGSNTQEMCDEIHTRLPNKKIIVYPDPSGKARKTAAGGKSDFSILHNNGFIVKAPNSHMPVRDRVNCVNSKLCNADGVQGIIINPKCKNLLNSIAKQVYKEGTSVPDKSQGLDHATDALGYLVSYLFPITRHYDASEPQRFAVQTRINNGRI